MAPRAGRAAVRQSAQAAPVYQPFSFPAPTLGIIANNNLASPQPGGAYLMENILPTSTNAVLRRGSQRRAIIGSEGLPVTALFAYVNGNVKIMFAANATGIYDVTTPTLSEDIYLTDDDGNFIIDDDGRFLVILGTPLVSVGDFTGGDWSVVQFGTPGGVYLHGVNGVDTPIVFDGTSWGTSPAITSADMTFDPQSLCYTWVHQSREWFIEKESLSAWYLPANSIGGDAVEFPMKGIFTKGGSLLFGSTWSLETGSGGLSEHCIFVTTEGEVAVYSGGDPSTSETWQKVGIYQIGKPLGKDAHFRAGGDIVISTDIGLIPLSQAVQKDFSVLSQTAVSAQIDAIWNQEVRDRVGGAWQCAVWSRQQLAVVAPYSGSGQSAVMYVAHTRTGAWAKITGWNATQVIVFDNRLFWGTRDGRVIEGNVTGLDQSAPYTGVYVPSFHDFGSSSSKTTGMTRTVIRATAPVNEQVTMQKEYTVSLPAAPSPPSRSGGNVWGEAIWGQAVWGAEAQKQTYQTWHSTPANGSVLAPLLQITSGSITPLDAEIIKTDVTFIQNGVVV